MSSRPQRGRRQTYSFFFFDPNSAWKMSTLFTIGAIILSIVIFVLYNRFSNDPTPDSIAGYLYAIAGSFFMFLAALGYTLKRRSRQRVVGQLNGLLHWHVAFGILALVLLCLHSFGNFNPRTGTYALWGMIALVISGIIGRALDRIIPRLMAKEVKRAMTEQGEDRVEFHTQTIGSIVSYNSQKLQSFMPEQPKAASVGKKTPWSPDIKGLPTAWDMAYISLEETPQEVAREDGNFRFVPDRRSELSSPEALMPGVQKHLTELQSAQKALGREEYYRAIIRYWRIAHVTLVVITIGLTLWHLEYATTLLLPMFLK